jgi:hypothetical protein
MVDGRWQEVVIICTATPTAVLILRYIYGNSILHTRMYSHTHTHTHTHIQEIGEFVSPEDFNGRYVTCNM